MRRSSTICMQSSLIELQSKYNRSSLKFNRCRLGDDSLIFSLFRSDPRPRSEKGERVFPYNTLIELLRRSGLIVVDALKNVAFTLSREGVKTVVLRR